MNTTEKVALTVPQISDLLKTHLNQTGFYTRRSIQKILREKNYSVGRDRVSDALNYLAKKKEMKFDKATKFWTWQNIGQPAEQPAAAAALVFKKEYVEKTTKQIYHDVVDGLRNVSAQMAVKSVEACIDEKLTKMILDHSEKVALNEIRVNLRSQVNQYIKDVVDYTVSERLAEVKQTILKIVKKDIDRLDKKLSDMFSFLEDLSSKFNF